MRNFFRRFFLGDFGPPPPPDLTDQPTISGESIIEILYSEHNERRAVITCDKGSVYRIYIQYWDIFDWKAGHGASWSHASGIGSLTDSIETARSSAREQLGTSTSKLS